MTWFPKKESTSLLRWFIGRSEQNHTHVNDGNAPLITANVHAISWPIPGAVRSRH